MKHILNTLLAAIVCILAGCQAQDALQETMTNGVELTIPGNAILSEDDTASIFVHDCLCASATRVGKVVFHGQ